MIWAWLFVALLAALAIFQIAVAAGAPLGRFTWGGAHPGVLPAGLRVAAVVSILIYAVMAALALDRAGAVELVPDDVAAAGMWVVVGFCVFSVVPNAISRSAGERYVMTPVSVALAVLALLVALG
ncbi:hypothetical protein [Nocardia farcinica]|nr:hypothetical protein [Nocardia farcinica]